MRTILFRCSNLLRPLTALALMLSVVALSGVSVRAQDAGSVKAKPANPAPASASQAKSQTNQKTTSGKATSGKDKTDTAKITMSQYLDRLMRAESNGRDNAANPRSSARGAFQFINSTFLYVARRHFAADVAGLSTAQILALRHNRAFARKAAQAYSEENAAHLAKRGAKPTFVNLRLAFLLGPSAATRVVTAPSKTPLHALLSAGALKANPFMRKMTARDLIARAARDLSVDTASLAGVKVKPVTGGAKKKVEPKIKVRCNLSRPSCRRWLALQKRKLQRLSLRGKKTK